MTVLFCDLVGSTSLFADLDAEDMGDVMRAYTRGCAERIEAAGGFVAQFQGDGVLGYFGYTQASENNAERAVRTALALTEEIPKLFPRFGDRLRVRIGISTGLAVVGDPLGEGTRLEQGAVGETLHLAHRMQSLAAADEVVIAHSTRQLVGDLFVYEDMGTRELRGFAAPVRIWKVLSARTMATQFMVRPDPLQVPIAGRDAEQALMAQTWIRSRSGTGQALAISGEAGIGKSRLINEFRAAMAGEDHVWLEGGGTQFFGNQPFYAIAQMIKRALDPAGLTSPLEFQGILERRLGEIGMDVARGSAAVRELLGWLTSDPNPVVPAAERRARFLAASIDYIRKRAAQKPLVIVLEDLQWVDPSSLELIGGILRGIETLPAMLILTARPGFVLPWPLPRHASALDLEPLDDDAVRGLVGHVLGRAAPADVTETILSRAEGIPLFAIELARLVSEQSPARPGRDIPSTLQDLLTARLDRLGSAKEVAQVAAVIGGEVGLPFLAAVMGVAPSRLRSRLAVLKKEGILRESGHAPDLVYGFTGSLLRDAAYEALLRSDRRQLHRRAAEVLEDGFPDLAERRPEMAAHHWAEASEAMKAAAWWRRAGAAAGARRAFQEAERAWRAAIAVLESIPASEARDSAELEAQSALADVSRMTHGYAAPETVAAMERARALADGLGDRPRLFAQIWGEWAVAAGGGDHAAAFELGERYLRLARANGDADHLARAHMALMIASHRAGDLIAAEHYFGAGEALFAEPGFAREQGMIAQTYGNAARIAWILDDGDSAWNRIDHALAVADRNESPFDRAASRYTASVIALLDGDMAAAEAFARKSVALSDAHGFPLFAALSRVTLGRAQAGLGFDAEGLATMQAGLAAMEAISTRTTITLYLTWLGELHAAAGRAEDALAAFDRALSVSPAERFFRPETLRLRGSLLMSLGRFGEAERDFLDALSMAGRMGAKRFSRRTSEDLRRLVEMSVARDAVDNLA